jgi:hypothetical protein
MKRLLIILSIITLGLVSVSAIAKDKEELPEFTVEGLKRVHDAKGMALVYADENADLSQYDRVYLVEPYVAFKKNWQRDQNRGAAAMKVRTSDMDRIKVNVKELFMEVFTEELQQGGYELANERAADVLIVKPAIIDLDVNAPDIRSAGRTNTYASSAGSMKLYLELYDSETDDLLAKALDAKADRDHGFMQWQTSAANRQAAKRMMKPWAEALRTGLDRARDLTRQEKE